MQPAFPAAFTHERSAIADHGTLAWATQRCAQSQWHVGTTDTYGTTCVKVAVEAYPGSPRLRWRQAYGVCPYFRYTNRPKLGEFRGCFLWLPK